MEDKNPVAGARREPPLPRGSGCRAQGQATGLVRSWAASPLRVSAGISPDFAGSCDGRNVSVPYTPPRGLDAAAHRQIPGPTACGSAPSVVVVNTGDGKGKSSAAFGVMVRGIARGWNVAVVQFVKSGDWKVGEEKIGRQLGVDWLAVGDGFTWDSDDLEHDKALAADGWQQAADADRRRRAPARRSSTS